MKFVLQKIYPLFDFQNTLLHAQKYWEWREAELPENEKTEFLVRYEDEDIDDPWEWCPVGSVEFCQAWYSAYLDKVAYPRNIPELEELDVFTRPVYILTTGFESWWKGSKEEFVFVKSREKIKHPLNGRYKIKDIPEELLQGKGCQIHYEIPGLRSEWRCFVLDGELIDLKCYQFNEGIEKGLPYPPDYRAIQNIIRQFKGAPRAYTLDVGESQERLTYIIEVHDFFACGLYGFADLEKLPLMYWRWWLEFKSNETNKA